MSLENLKQDLMYAARGLRLKPAFAIAVITTLGLGLGANAAMFGIVDRLLFRPPPFLKDPETVHRVYFYQTFRGAERPMGGAQYARYADLSRWTTRFSDRAGYTGRDLAVGAGDAAREMRVGVVSAGFFPFFDAPPVLGRYFMEAEDRPPDGSAVAVLSHAMWQTQYGSRRDVLGAPLRIGPITYTIIGVAPRGFVGLWADKPPAAFIPMTSYAAASGFLTRTASWWETYSWSWMSMMVRRKPGVTLAAANADVTQAYVKSYEAQRLEQTKVQPTELARPRAVVASILPERGPTASNVAKVATWVGGMSVIVLLIACANVANLLLARALRRRREIALRVALGVKRGRLAAQLLTESVLLALLGGVVGVIVAHWGGAALRAGLMEGSQAAAGLRDPRTVAYAGVAAVLVGLITGLAPVLQAGRADLVSDLKAGVREGTHARSRVRTFLLVFQAALSVLLLVGAGLFVRSLRNVRATRLGYDVDPILLVDLQMRGERIDTAQTVALRARLLDAAKSIPGVENASLQSAVPFWSSRSLGLHVEGIDTVSRLGQFDMNAVSPEFFATIGTRIVRGRGISNEDTPQGPKAIVVSANMGKVLWPGRDPMGQCIRVGADTVPCSYVVGIAENIKEQNIGPDSGYYYYVSAAQHSFAYTGGLFVRTRGEGIRLREAVRRRLQREMPGASYVNVTPFSEIVGSQTRSWRLGATMFVVFGGLALLLAAIGLYSVISYNVAQRTHELGVRVALGARGGDVVRMVVGDGLRVAGTGVFIGTGVALWAGKWLKPLLFDVAPTDLTVFTFVSVVLVAVAVVASWVPARRAARVNPQVALRSE